MFDEILLRQKARRRIRKFIANPTKHQARVYPTNKKRVYEYKVKHHVRSLYFKHTLFLGRLKVVADR